MKIRKMTLATAIAMVMAAPMSFADTMDKEGDSKADRQGATSEHHGGKTARAEEFKMMDTNGDGVISEQELNVYGSTAAGGAGSDSEAERNRMGMDNVDANEDGEISRQEYMDAADNQPETGSDY